MITTLIIIAISIIFGNKISKKYFEDEETNENMFRNRISGFMFVFILLMFFQLIAASYYFDTIKYDYPLQIKIEKSVDLYKIEQTKTGSFYLYKEKFDTRPLRVDPNYKLKIIEWDKEYYKAEIEKTYRDLPFSSNLLLFPVSIFADTDYTTILYFPKEN